MITVGEGLCTGLEVFRCVNDGVGLIVVLNDLKKSLDGISLFPQSGDLFIDARHGEKHLQRFPQAVLHVLRGIAVESEGGRGGNIGQPVLHRHQLAPECD